MYLCVCVCLCVCEREREREKESERETHFEGVCGDGRESKRWREISVRPSVR